MIILMKLNIHGIIISKINKKHSNQQKNKIYKKFMINRKK